jgi:hypothetical protein
MDGKVRKLSPGNFWAADSNNAVDRNPPGPILILGPV